MKVATCPHCGTKWNADGWTNLTQEWNCYSGNTSRIISGTPCDQYSPRLLWKLHTENIAAVDQTLSEVRPAPDLKQNNNRSTCIACGGATKEVQGFISMMRYCPSCEK